MTIHQIKLINMGNMIDMAKSYPDIVIELKGYYDDMYVAWPTSNWSGEPIILSGYQR